MQKRTINFGQVKQLEKVVRSVDLTKPVQKVSTSCGCTASTMAGNRLIITYSTPPFPGILGMLDKKVMPVTQTVTVYYKDDTKELIEITGEILP